MKFLRLSFRFARYTYNRVKRLKRAPMTWVVCWLCGRAFPYRDEPGRYRCGWCYPDVLAELHVKISKPQTSGQSVLGELKPGAFGEWWDLFPAVCEFLSAVKWEDGSDRKTGTLNLFLQDGKLKCWLNDKEFGRSLCRSGDSLDELLQALDTALSDPRADWRADGRVVKKK